MRGVFGTIAILSAFTFSTLHAQSWPSKPIHLLVPFVPGGNVDITARAVAPGLQEVLGQPVIVENRPGAGGTIAASQVAKASPDGYTLLMGSTSTLSVAPALYQNVYHPVNDFSPIVMLQQVPFVLVAHPSVPARTVGELVSLAKSRPGTITMASAGSGSSNHLAGELFQSSTGTKFVHIPYKGSGQAVADLIGGQVQLYFDQLTTEIGNIKSGKVRALAVSSARRWTALPEVPTFIEADVRGYEVLNVTGLVAPSGTPREIIRQLHAASIRVLESPVVRERFAALGVEPVGGRPEQFGEYIHDDFARWRKVIADGNIKAE
jgi:tripartite-type tricarboxylate transporter receptor subunit TctC